MEDSDVAHSVILYKQTKWNEILQSACTQAHSFYYDPNLLRKGPYAVEASRLYTSRSMHWT